MPRTVSMTMRAELSHIHNMLRLFIEFLYWMRKKRFRLNTCSMYVIISQVLYSEQSIFWGFFCFYSSTFAFYTIFVEYDSVEFVCSLISFQFFSEFLSALICRIFAFSPPSVSFVLFLPSLYSIGEVLFWAIESNFNHCFRRVEQK